MVRGLYTGASGMVARTHQMDVVANNLANVNTTAYKQDITAFKSFPEMMIRRFNDDGVKKFPLGSIDKRPVVGKLGTGVEVNEVYTRRDQGSLRKTENPLDFALKGKGYFTIKTDDGLKYTRNGTFTIGKEGLLVTKDGFPVMGENGPINLKKNNFVVKEDGSIYINNSFKNPNERQVQLRENGFDDAQLIDKLKIVEFPMERYIKKVGNSFYVPTEVSGEPRVNPKSKTSVAQGFTELSNVKVIKEMVRMIEIQRSYEASQKTITSHDAALDKLINQMSIA